MDQRQLAICGNQATGAAASNFKSAAFNNSNMFCHLNQKLGSIHSLDVLASDNELFRNPDNHWVVPLTIFHYMTKGKSRNWGTDHAIVLTLADLFCDGVPDHLRSKNGIENLAKSAKEYISKMADYNLQWSTINAADYQSALQNNLSWPTIVNPDLDSTGSTVSIDKLLEAWVFCFKHSTVDAAMKINPGILALLFCYASHGENIPKNAEVVNTISERMGSIEKVSVEFLNSIVEHLIPIVSINNAQTLYTNFVKSLPAFISSQMEEEMENLVCDRLEVLSITTKAEKDFRGFLWESLRALVPSESEALMLAQRLVSRSRYFGFIHNKDAASSVNFPTLAHAARKLFFNVGDQWISPCDFYEVSKPMAEIVNRLLGDYVKKLKLVGSTDVKVRKSIKSAVQH